MMMTTKQEIFKEKLEEYLAASKAEKGQILSMVCGVTGAHKKSAIRRFRTLQMKDNGIPDRRGRPTIYTKAVEAALKEIWECANQICAERLHPMIDEYVAILKRDKMWKNDSETTELLLRMSLGTMKNKLDKFPHPKAKKSKSATKPSNLKEIIPIRRGPWQNPDPGYGEVDTVAHCGSTLQGDFAYTVQAEQASQFSPERVSEWAELGKNIALAFTTVAKELGVAADQFLQSTTGKVTLVLIIWKVAGQDILGLAIGVIFLLTFIPLWVYFFRRLCLIKSMTVEAVEGQRRPKRTIEYFGEDIDGKIIVTRWVMLFVLILIVIVGLSVAL